MSPRPPGWSPTRQRFLPVLAGGLLASACGVDLLNSPDDGRNPDSPPNDPCNQLMAQVEGTWSLTGNGVRSACADEGFNADRIDLRLQPPLRIRQSGPLLELDPSQAASLPTFTFTAEPVEGACLRFQMADRVGDLVVAYRFSGQLLSDPGSTTRRQIGGSFVGSGPGFGCQATGTFQIEVGP